MVSYFAYIPTGEIFFSSYIFKLHIEILTVIQWRRPCGKQDNTQRLDPGQNPCTSASLLLNGKSEGSLLRCFQGFLFVFLKKYILLAK